MQTPPSIVHIRSDVFEHAVYPTPTKLTLINLVNLISNLNSIASIDKRVTMDQFKEAMLKHTTNISDKDAEIYFLSYKLITEDDLNFLIAVARKSQGSQ